MKRSKRGRVFLGLGATFALVAFVATFMTLAIPVARPGGSPGFVATLAAYGFTLVVGAFANRDSDGANAMVFVAAMLLVVLPLPWIFTYDYWVPAIPSWLAAACYLGAFFTRNRS